MNYSGISECDVLNGVGFRVVLFVSGCNHHCYNCHNKETWNTNYGYQFTEKTKQYILDCLSKDYIDGITLSGGDPLHENNSHEIYMLCRAIKEKFPNKTIWLYTGYQFEEVNDWLIMQYIDILVDGRYVDSLRNLNLKWRGSSNQRVIDVQKSLKQNKVITLPNI